jgi:hypothetical protein
MGHGSSRQHRDGGGEEEDGGRGGSQEGGRRRSGYVVHQPSHQPRSSHPPPGSSSLRPPPPPILPAPAPGPAPGPAPVPAPGSRHAVRSSSEPSTAGRGRYPYAYAPPSNGRSRGQPYPQQQVFVPYGGMMYSMPPYGGGGARGHPQFVMRVPPEAMHQHRGRPPAHFLQHGGNPMNPGMPYYPGFIPARPPPQPRVTAPPPRMEQTETIKNYVSLNKKSLRLEHVESEPSSFILSFTVDAEKDFLVLISFVALAARDEMGKIHFPPIRGVEDHSFMQFGAGLGQRINFSILPMDVRQFPSDLVFVEKEHWKGVTKFPVVIELQPIPDQGKAGGIPGESERDHDHFDASAGSPPPHPPPELSSQFTFCTLIKNTLPTTTSKETDPSPSDSETSIGIAVIKQSISVRNRLYELQEIYGMDDEVDVKKAPSGSSEESGGAVRDEDEASMSEKSEKDDMGKGEGKDEVDELSKEEEGTEGGATTKATTTSLSEESVCVICLTEKRDTTVFPCRHMCLCSECAGQLRYRDNRCPICRARASPTFFITAFV